MGNVKIEFKSTFYSITRKNCFYKIAYKAIRLISVSTHIYEPLFIYF